MSLRVAVFGASGQSKVVVDILRLSGHEVVGYLDNDLPPGTERFGLPVLGPDEAVPDLADRFDGAAMGIGDNALRGKVVAAIEQASPDIEWVAAIHPSAVVAAGCEVGRGVRLMAGAVVNPDCVLGDHGTVDTNASLDHDSRLGRFASLGPNVATGGGCDIGDFTAIGLGASIVHDTTIGEHTVVGAGSLVLEDLPDRVVAYGTPARVVRPRQPGERYL